MVEKLDAKEMAECRRHLHYKPTRSESLLARIDEIDIEINQLIRIRATYEVELAKIAKEKNDQNRTETNPH